jgi:cholesterol transport system auxiliary component
LLLTACAGSRPVHYYSLNRPETPVPAVNPAGPVLLVGRIATPEALEDGRIRYRSSGNEVGSYEYHRWTERPGVMVRDLLIQTLRASGQFHQVQEAAGTVGGDYLIRGKLYDFSELDEPGILTRVSLHLELVDRKTGLVVWDHRYNRDQPVTGKAMKEVVASLDQNLQYVVREASAGIEEVLAGRKQSGPS